MIYDRSKPSFISKAKKATENTKTWRRKNKNSTIFPEDITIEIFSRLPIKSLLRFKCLSNFFNFLVSESYFVDIHECRSMSTRLGEIKFFVPETEGFYSIEMKKDGEVSRYKFDFRYDDLSYHNGLFCFWVKNLESVRIFNPGTREVILLPKVKQLYPLRNLKESYLSSYYGCSYTLGYEPEEKKYKVFMSLCITSECTRNWVFTLGTDKSWREIDRVTYFPHKREICVCGVIYILDCSNTFIVAFDLKTENFKFIPLWSGANHWNRDYALKEVKGKLAVWDCCSDEGVNLRVLADQKNEEWQSHNIQFPSRVKNIGTYKICSSCDGEILVFFIRLNASVKARSCYCYDVREDTWKYLKTSLFCFTDWIDEGICTYVESLFPLKKVCNASSMFDACVELRLI